MNLKTPYKHTYTQGWINKEGQVDAEALRDLVAYKVINEVKI